MSRDLHVVATLVDELEVRLFQDGLREGEREAAHGIVTRRREPQLGRHVQLHLVRFSREFSREVQ